MGSSKNYQLVALFETFYGLIKMIMQNKHL